MNEHRLINFLLRSFVVLVFIFIFMPIAGSFVFSFNIDRFPSLPLGGFSLHWYEAIAADPRGRGWWVAYEQIHSLLLYSRDFGRLLARLPVESADFRPNRGIEAIYPAGKGVAWRSEASGASDAARLPDGRLAILERRVGLFGFESRITGLGRPIELRLGRFDNPEAITAAPLPSGGTRLWVMTDNDLERWRPTLLLAIDLPKAPAR